MCGPAARQRGGGRRLEEIPRQSSGHESFLRAEQKKEDRVAQAMDTGALQYRRVVLLIALAIVSMVILAVSPFVGMDLISPADALGHGIISKVFRYIRIPRVLTGFIAGSTLALCGMVFQAVFRNPLATPFTLGVSSGASFGAAATILLGVSGSIARLPASSIGAFLGALTAMLLVYGLSRLVRAMSNLTMLLAGVAVSFFFSSLLMFTQYLSSLRHSFRITRWLMGGLEVYGYDSLAVMVPFVLVSFVVFAVKLRELDHLVTGEDLARTRGINVARTKIVLFFATSLAVSSVVAVCGPIGFVGLMVPHACRMIFGGRHWILAPATFLLGGTFLVVSDTVARTVIAPAEIPVGVVTSLLGGPFFLWVLFRSSRKGPGMFW